MKRDRKKREPFRGGKENAHIKYLNVWTFTEKGKGIRKRTNLWLNKQKEG